MTSSLPPPRDTADFFRAGDYRESRATIDGATPTSSRLTDAQLARARERNPYWQDKLGFSPSLFGGGDVSTGEFAENVADKQASLGLPVDGIAGPRTFDALTKGTSAASEDPFAMHLVDDRPRRGARPAERPRSAAEPDRTPPTEVRLRSEVTDVQPKDDGVQIVIGAGANHGVDETWHVHVLGCNLRWEITEVRANATVVVARRGRVDDVLGLSRADLAGVPRVAPLAAVDASDEPEPAWWTFED